MICMDIPKIPAICICSICGMFTCQLCAFQNSVVRGDHCPFCNFSVGDRDGNGDIVDKLIYDSDPITNKTIGKILISCKKCETQVSLSKYNDHLVKKCSSSTRSRSTEEATGRSVR